MLSGKNDQGPLQNSVIGSIYSLSFLSYLTGPGQSA